MQPGKDINLLNYSWTILNLEFSSFISLTPSLCAVLAETVHPHRYFLVLHTFCEEASQQYLFFASCTLGKGT